MALSMKTALVSAPLATKARVQARVAAPMTVRSSAEQSSRRAALSLIASTLTAGAALKAQAITIPSQDSTGSTGKKGALPSSTSRASMESFTMEGTRKGGITPKRKAELIAKLRKAEGL